MMCWSLRRNFNTVQRVAGSYIYYLQIWKSCGEKIKEGKWSEWFPSSPLTTKIRFFSAKIFTLVLLAFGVLFVCLFVCFLVIIFNDQRRIQNTSQLERSTVTCKDPVFWLLHYLKVAFSEAFSIAASCDLCHEHTHYYTNTHTQSSKPFPIICAVLSGT